MAVAETSAAMTLDQKILNHETPTGVLRFFKRIHDVGTDLVSVFLQSIYIDRMFTTFFLRDATEAEMTQFLDLSIVYAEAVDYSPVFFVRQCQVTADFKSVAQRFRASLSRVRGRAFVRRPLYALFRLKPEYRAARFERIFSDPSESFPARAQRLNQFPLDAPESEFDLPEDKAFIPQILQAGMLAYTSARVRRSLFKYVVPYVPDFLRLRLVLQFLLCPAYDRNPQLRKEAYQLIVDRYAKEEKAWEDPDYAEDPRERPTGPSADLFALFNRIYAEVGSYGELEMRVLLEGGEIMPVPLLLFLISKGNAAFILDLLDSYPELFADNPRVRAFFAQEPAQAQVA